MVVTLEVGWVATLDLLMSPSEMVSFSLVSISVVEEAVSTAGSRRNPSWEEVGMFGGSEDEEMGKLMNAVGSFEKNERSGGCELRWMVSLLPLMTSFWRK